MTKKVDMICVSLMFSGLFLMFTATFHLSEALWPGIIVIASLITGFITGFVNGIRVERVMKR